MLDVMSGGRLVAGMVIGGGPEYFTYQRQSDHGPREVPRGARPDRQGVDDAGAVPVELEALLLPLRQPLAAAAAAAAPADLDSRASAAWRRSSSSPSAATPTWAFRTSTSTSSAASSASSARPARRPATPPHPEQMGWGVPIYVAETDKQAREEFEPHFWYFVSNLLKGIGLAPPGYTSPKSAAGHPQEPASTSCRRRRPGTTSRRASSPSSAARRRCGRSWSTTRRSWASASC